MRPPVWAFLPGDILPNGSLSDQTSIGFPHCCASLNEDNQIVANRPVVVSSLPLRRKEPLNVLLSCRERYFPAPGDTVIGVVKRKMGEHYKVDIQASSTAWLPVLSFSGATKQNNPRLENNTIVVCTVVQCHPDGETIVSCDPLSERTTWASGSYLGELRGGFMKGIPEGLAYSLMSHGCYLPKRMYKRKPDQPQSDEEFGPFEIAVGCNGRLWVKGKSAGTTLRIMQILQNCHGKSIDEVEKLVGQVSAVRE